MNIKRDTYSPEGASSPVPMAKAKYSANILLKDLEEDNETSLSSNLDETTCEDSDNSDSESVTPTQQTPIPKEFDGTNRGDEAEVRSLINIAMIRNITINQFESICSFIISHNKIFSQIMVSKAKPGRRRPKLSIARFMREYSNRTTVHGISYICDTTIAHFDRCLWFVLCVFFTFLAVFVSVKAYIDWQDDPVITTLLTTGE